MKDSPLLSVEEREVYVRTLTRKTQLSISTQLMTQVIKTKHAGQSYIMTNKQ